MEYYASLLLFTFVAGITPGPNNMMLMASGLNHGISKSMPHYLGICIGFPLMVAVLGFGMGEILSRHPSIYLYLKISGISYLLFLAWKIGNSGNKNASTNIRNPLTLLQAAAFQWLNPKAWAIAIGALAAFSNEKNFNFGVISVILAYFSTGLICMAFWLKLGHSLKGLLNTVARVKYFNLSMAILLVLSVIPMLFTNIGGA